MFFYREISGFWVSLKEEFVYIHVHITLRSNGKFRKIGILFMQG